MNNILRLGGLLMRAGAVRRPWQLAGVAAVAVAALAGCGATATSTSGASATPTGSSGTASGQDNALSAVQLAAQTASGANSVTGTMNLQVTEKAGATPAPAASGPAGSGSFSAAASFAEQLHPSLLAQIDISSLAVSGTTLPGGLSEILTPSTLYLRSSYLAQSLHSSKPWMTIPLSSLSKGSGVNITDLLGSLTGNGPTTESGLLAGATSVRRVGTGTVGGVPVTEYSGTLSLDKALAKLPASTRAQLQTSIDAAGFKTATFSAWIDGSHLVRKAVVSESGTALTEVTTTTITSINKPVTITPPAAGETQAVPNLPAG
jgi:hypothetical protein